MANPLRNPAWILVPLLPLAVLPVKIGGAIFLLMSISGFAYAAYRLGASPRAMGAFIASPPVLHCLLNGNVDWIPLVGATLSPQIGLFLVVAKPQIGMTIALFWLIEAWRKGGVREVVRVFTPVTVAFLITFALFGFWVRSWTDNLGQWWNASLFPWSVPVGLYLMVRAIREREIKYAHARGSGALALRALSLVVGGGDRRGVGDRWALAVSGVVGAHSAARGVSESLVIVGDGGVGGKKAAPHPDPLPGRAREREMRRSEGFELTANR